MGTVIRIAPCAQHGCLRSVRVDERSLCGAGQADRSGHYGCALVFCSRHFGPHLCLRPRCTRRSDDGMQWQCDLARGHHGPHSVGGEVSVFYQPGRMPARPALRLITC